MASRLWINSVFQQSDQLSETPAAGCHRKNVLPYTGLPQCDEHVEEGSVRKELPSKPSVGASFPMWVRVFPCGCEFPTCTCLRQDEISSPQRDVGYKLSHVGASFQLAHAFDKMKSRRHKRYRNLILTDFEPELFEFWVHVFNP